MAAEDPFRVLVRKESAYESSVTLRFNVTEGMGQIALKAPGRADPPLAVHFEEPGVDPELLRAARFVYALNQMRQSFALSRVTPEQCSRLPTDQWVELKAIIEYGFRYLIIPEESLAAGVAPVQVQVAASVAPASGVRSVAPASVAAVRVGEAAPSQRAEPAQRPETPSSPVNVRGVERPVPMEPGLAAAALDGLSRESAIGHLRTQLASVEALHQKIELLERKLASARARERDLLGVLTRWQEREEPS